MSALTLSKKAKSVRVPYLAASARVTSLKEVLSFCFLTGTGWWAEVDGDGCRVREGERFRLCVLLVGSATAVAGVLGGGVGVLAALTGG